MSVNKIICSFCSKVITTGHPRLSSSIGSGVRICGPCIIKARDLIAGSPYSITDINTIIKPS